MVPFRDWLHSFARAKFGSLDADDLVQETMLKAWHHRRSFRAGSSMKSWLFFILRNLALTQIRKRIRHGEIPLEITTADGERQTWDLPVVGRQNGVIELDEVLTALSHLSLEKIDTVLLVARGYSLEEVADMLCVCSGTVKSRISRARRDLKVMTE